MAELRAIPAVPAPTVRVAGLLKGKVEWAPDAFAPMSADELAELDGAPIFSQDRPSSGQA